MPHDTNAQSEPKSAVAGDTWQWERELTDHLPSDGWTLSYVFVGPSKLEVTATPSGETYQISVPPDQTADLKPGLYRWRAYVSKATDRFSIDDGRLIVEADLAQEVTTESHAEKMIALLQTAIEEKVTLGTTNIEINGRQAQLIPTIELRQLLGHYRSELRRSRHPDKLGGRVEVHFGPS